MFTKMNTPCESCGKQREKCRVCGCRDATKCCECTDLLSQVEGVVLCNSCKPIYMCSFNGCGQLKRNCVKCGSDLQTCLYHHHMLGICHNCVATSICFSCYELKINTWSHKCGTFCKDCVPRILIDISPITLAKLHEPYPGGFHNLIDRELVKCEKCMEGKTVLEWQLSYPRPIPSNFREIIPCSKCNKISNTTWSHKCGIFCEECEPIIKVPDRSYRPNAVRKYDVSRLLYKCSRCLD